jgi:hypothetical protein
MLMLGAGAARSAEPAPAAASAREPGPSKEAREKMALMHEKMAACLRSEKSLAECSTEMLKNCRDIMGPENCPGAARHRRPAADGTRH